VETGGKGLRDSCCLLAKYP